MNDLERFYACMNYQSLDKSVFWSSGAWPETIERWKKEGYEPDKFDLNMGSDRRNWIGGWFFPNPPFEEKIVSEDEKYILYINHEGILMREFKTNRRSSMPQFVKFPVENREEFYNFWKEKMNPDLTKRIGADWKEQLKEIRSKPYPFIIISDRWGGFFGPLRNLFGIEKLSTLFYDDPSFLEEIMDAEVDYIISIMEQILDVVVIDAFGFWEDMAYNSAPLLSPQMVSQYMLPRYIKVVNFLVSHKVQFIGLDSDGQIDSLIPIWMSAGLNFLYPFEVQCGMDVLNVRKKYGKNLRIWGGADKRALAKGPEFIDRELNRIKPLIKERGYIPHLDHSAPPDISFSNYCYYMKKLEEVCSY